MFACPHCFIPLTGRVKVKREQGSADLAIACSNCQSILRVQITTLKEPDPEKLQKNMPPPSASYCGSCGKEYPALKTHNCPDNEEPPPAAPITQVVQEEQEGCCPHGKRVTDPRFPGLSGNCNVCRGSILGSGSQYADQAC